MTLSKEPDLSDPLQCPPSRDHRESQRDPQRRHLAQLLAAVHADFGTTHHYLWSLPTGDEGTDPFRIKDTSPGSQCVFPLRVDKLNPCMYRGHLRNSNRQQ